MDRREILLEFASRAQRGLEIGPFFNPLAPKADGWNVLSLDVFDAPTLLNIAANDANIPDSMMPNIEEVDLLGPAHRLAELVAERGELGEFDFIVSSHNFEHLPNPIGFLQSCSETLRPGGVLSMAIPDKRTCFDYFRPVSTLGSILEAYADKRQRPSLAQLFDLQSLHCRYSADGGDLIAFPLTNDPSRITALQTVQEAYQAWHHRLAGGGSLPYEDCHCWTFTPNSFRVLTLDLCFLRIVDFEPLRISDTCGGEFFVHLQNTRGAPPVDHDPGEYYAERQRLLHQANADGSVNAFSTHSSPSPAEPHASAEPLDSGLRQEIALLQEELSALRASNCWRMTAPIRYCVDLLRRRTG